MKLKGRTDLLCDLPNGMRSRRFDGLPNTFGDGFDWQNELRHDHTFGRSVAKTALIRVHEEPRTRADDFDFRYPRTENVLNRDRLNVKHDYARGRLTKRDYLNDRCSINARIFTEQFFGR